MQTAELTCKSFPTIIKTLLALLIRKLFLLFCKCLTLGKLRDVVLTGSGDETGGGGEAWLGLCNPLWQPPQHLLRLNPSPILRDNRKRARLGQQDNKTLDTSLEIWCSPPQELIVTMLKVCMPVPSRAKRHTSLLHVWLL